MSATVLAFPEVRVPEQRPAPDGFVVGARAMPPHDFRLALIELLAEHGVDPGGGDGHYALGHSLDDLRMFVDAYRTAPVTPGGAS